MDSHAQSFMSSSRLFLDLPGVLFPSIVPCSNSFETRFDFLYSLVVKKKFKSQGNGMNCPENKYKFLTPTPPGGGGDWSLRGQKFGKFHELPRKLIHSVTPHPHSPGRGFGDTISAWNFEKYIGNAIILSDYTPNIPGEARSEGGSREGGEEGGSREGGSERASACNLGLIFYNHFRRHISITHRNCFYHIRNLRCIRRYLTLSIAKTIATILVRGRLDYTVMEMRKLKTLVMMVMKVVRKMTMKGVMKTQCLMF